MLHNHTPDFFAFPASTLLLAQASGFFLEFGYLASGFMRPGRWNRA